MSTAYLVAGVRTPIGRYAGGLAPVRTDDLAAHAVSSLVDRFPTVDWGRVDDVILGCANQAGRSTGSAPPGSMPSGPLPERSGPVMPTS